MSHLYGGGKRTRARAVPPPLSPESKTIAPSATTTTNSASATATSTSQVAATPYNSTTTEWCAKEKACVANAREKELELAARQAYIERLEIQNTQLLSAMASCGWTGKPNDDHKESEAVVHRRNMPNKPAMFDRVKAWTSSCETRLKGLQGKETKIKEIKERAESFVASDMLHDGDIKTRTASTDLPLDVVAEPQLSAKHTLAPRKQDWNAKITAEFEAWERCKDNIVKTQNTIESEFGLIADAQDRYVAELNPIHTKRSIDHQDSAASLLMSSGNLSVPASKIARRWDSDHWHMWETGYQRLQIVETFWEIQYGVVLSSLLDKYGRLAETNWHLVQFTRQKMKKVAEDHSRSIAAAVPRPLPPLLRYKLVASWSLGEALLPYYYFSSSGFFYRFCSSSGFFYFGTSGHLSYFDFGTSGHSSSSSSGILYFLLYSSFFFHFGSSGYLSYFDFGFPSYVSYV